MKKSTRFIFNSLYIIVIFSWHYGYCQSDFYGNDNVVNFHNSSLLTNNYDSIVHSIPSPTVNTNGITFDGNSIWVASTGYMLYMISPIDGSIQKTIGIDIGYVTGLTFVEQYLYAVDRINKKICKIDTASGNILDSFNTPENNTDGFPSGLTWDGINLWYNCGGDVDSTYELNLYGQVLSQYKIIGDVPTGLTFDGSNLWSINTELDIIYQISLPNFELLGSINAPGEGYPNGLAFDGSYLWVSENSSNMIYQLYIGVISVINSNSLANGVLNVWPNPTFNFINVEIPASNTPVVLKIYNISRQMVKSFKINENKLSDNYQFNLSDLKSGIYFLTVNLNDITLSRKIIKR